MITALKQLYERHHAGDLRALKKAYEQHAKDCTQAAEITVDAGRREVYLKLARQWTEAARAADDAQYRQYFIWLALGLVPPPLLGR
jgi:hypothetical protein